MQIEDLSVGMRVRYPRTGTSGNVTRIERQSGHDFAEIDSTHLLYRIDQLIPVEIKEKKNVEKIEDYKKKIEQEREFASGSGLQDALKNIDQSCEGGG